jgi:hypothetical protein
MAYSSPLHRQSGCYDMASPVATVGNMLQLAPCLSRVLTPAGRTSARARRRHADGSGKECRRLRIRSTACTSYWLPTAEIFRAPYHSVPCQPPARARRTTPWCRPTPHRSSALCVRTGGGAKHRSDIGQRSSSGTSSDSPAASFTFIFFRFSALTSRRSRSMSNVNRSISACLGSAARVPIARAGPGGGAGGGPGGAG